MTEYPLVSCLCVTRNTLALLKRAIDCFKNQTYPNKELIVVSEDCDDHIHIFLTNLNDPTIHSYIVSAQPKMTLGRLRNLSIDYASGEYLCQWDADDWHHNQRIELQMYLVVNMHKPFCFLTYWILYDSLTNKAYLSRKRLWEGSMFCRKSTYLDLGLTYELIPKLEDFRLVENLLPLNLIYPIDVPHMYIYVYHGNNTWNYEHFKGNYAVGQELSSFASEMIHNILEGNISNCEASEIMSSASILAELNYAYEFY